MTTPTIIAPSPDRTVAVPSGALDPSVFLNFPTKTPGSVLDYALDVSAWLEDIEDTLGSFTATVNSGLDSDLLLTALSPVGNLLPVILSGGTEGLSYGVRFIVVGETTGLTLDIVVWISVMNISANCGSGRTQVAAFAFRTGTGAPATQLGYWDDLYLDLSTGNLWKKSYTAWSIIGGFALLNAENAFQGDVSIAGFLTPSRNWVSAAGQTSSTATLLTTDINIVSSASDVANGVRCSAAAGRQYIKNATSENINVYPSTGGTLAGGDTDQPVLLMPGLVLDLYQNPSAPGTWA